MKKLRLIIKISFFSIIVVMCFVISDLLMQYAGISSRNVNYQIIEGEVICEEHTVIELDGYDVFYYQIDYNKITDDLYDMQICINDEEIEYSIEENYYYSSKYRGIYEIDLNNYPSFSKIGKTKLDIYLKYKEDTSLISRYNNMDLIDIECDYKYYFLNNNNYIDNISKSENIGELLGYSFDYFINMFNKNNSNKNNSGNRSDIFLKDLKEAEFSYIKNVSVSLNSDIPIKNARVNIKNIDQESSTDYLYEFTVKKDILGILSNKGLYLGFNLMDDKNEELYNIEEREFDFKNLYDLEYEKEQLKTEREIKEIIYLCLLISIVILMISVQKNFKIINTKTCNKQYEGLISPVLAEVLIDGKIDLKSLIMSTIIDLHIRGNIEILNNNTIQLLKLDNLENYEKEIIKLIFNGKEIIDFKQINNVFKDSTKTFEFSSVLTNIKQEIIKKLYALNIYSERNSKITKIITIFPVLIMINLIIIVLFYNQFDFLRYDIYIIYWIIINFILIVFYMKKVLYNPQSTVRHFFINYSKNRERRRKSSNIVSIICFILICIYQIHVVEYSSLIMFLIFFIYAICIFTIKLNRNYSLTSKGFEEKEKLLQLRNYIKKYSLMKDRDLSSVIVWDKYIAYATAFEIPNKITDSIYKHWYDMNMNIQFIESIIEVFL